MAVDDRTTWLDLPKPAAANLLEEDVLRLREFADDVDLALHLRPLATGVTAEIAAAVAPLATASALTSGLAGKVSTSRTVSAGTGLTGGGALSGNISLALSTATITSLGKADAAAPASRTIFTSAGLTGGGDLTANRTITPTYASQAQAETGASEVVLLNPLRGAQLVAALRPWASQAQAVAGTDSTTAMTPQRTAQQIAAKPSGIPVVNKISAYVLADVDTGKCISITTGGITVPSTLAAGVTISIWNDSGLDQTITQGSGLTLYWTQDASTGSRTLAGRGEAVISVKAAGVATIGGAGLS